MSVFKGLNRLGRCAQCEELIFEVKTQYPHSHHYSMEARSLGKSLPNCRLVTLILMNGHQCDITMCDECTAQEKVSDLPRLWRKLLRTWQLEITDVFRINNNSPILSQRERELEERWFKKMIFNVPVGVLSIRKGDQNG